MSPDSVAVPGDVAVSKSTYESTYRRASSDKRFRAALEAQLDGEDVLELLRWLNHGDGAPPGMAAEVVDRDELVRLVHGRATEPAQREAAANQLIALDERIQEIRSTVDRAISVAQAVEQASTLQPVDTVAPRTSRRRTWWLLLLGAALLGASIVVTGLFLATTISPSTDDLIARFSGATERLGYETCAPQGTSDQEMIEAFYVCLPAEANNDPGGILIVVFSTTGSREDWAERSTPGYQSVGAKVVEHDRWLIAGTDHADLGELADELGAPEEQ